MAYIAPYLINTDYVPLPDGTFTVPVCTTRERFKKITNALWVAGNEVGDGSYEHLIDWLDACSRIVPGCVEFIDQCRRIALNDPMVEWYPESPYNPGAEVPDGYDFHPWTIANSDSLSAIIIAWGLGYKNGDVFTDLSKFPDITDPENFTESYLNLPRFRLSVVGTGTVKVDILSIPFGGRLVVLVDEFVDLLNLQAADTDRDASFPPESIVSMTIETEITTPGAHTIDYVFYPTFETELPILGGGGGIRSIEICGFGVDTMPTDYCCDETNDKLDESNKTLSAILELLKGGATITFNTQSEPEDYKADCSPDEFNKDTGETDVDVLIDRNVALCFTVANFIIAMLYKYGKQFNMTNATKAAILALMPIDVPPDFWSEVQLNSDSDANLSRIDRIASTDTTAFEDVLCMMVTNMKGKSNTLANFKLSVTLNAEETYLVNEVFWLTKIMYYATQTRVNYNIFARELNSSYEEIADGFVYECPCELGGVGDCEEPLDMIFKNDRGISITNVGGNLYHIIGGHKFGSGGEFGGVYLQDSSNRCFALEIPTGSEEGLPEGWAGVQPTTYHFVVGCCGSGDHSGGGGWENGAFTEAYWDCGDTTDIDTYYILRCLGADCQ